MARKRIAAYIDGELHDAVKIEAVKRGKTITEILTEALTGWLKKE